MRHLWLDRPWWRRGLLYHLYLVMLKDNGIRLQRAARRARVLTRWWLRAFRRWITGRSAMVPQLVRREVLVEGAMRRFRAQWDARVERRANNRDLLTGMTVALLHGPNRAPWSSWEYYRAHAGRRQSNYKPNRDRARLVGKPLVIQYPNKTKVGGTEWWEGYVPRAEQLAARKAA